MSGNKNNVVSLVEISNKKVTKEKELEFYRNHLKECESKISFIQRDIELTLEVIDMIENERILSVDTSVPIINIDTEDTPEK
ncbi:MAG TPA: hypothetical protein DCW83_08990 [Saprospirales bacterium]|jgi:hypothetical protein|nr:hypothetical protein [Saprospirales bacterium]